MNTRTTTRPVHHVLALALAAAVTFGVLGGLDAQADRVFARADAVPATPANWAGAAPVAPAQVPARPAV